MTDPTTSPDRGALAVGVVAIAFVFNAIARGVADSFGVFVLPLETEFGWSRRTVTGIFSATMLLSGLGAPLAGWAFDRWGPRAVYTGGAALLASGAALSSFATAPWHLVLSAGLLVGLGVAALGMVSAGALVARWHRRHLSTAIAVAYAGLGLGVLAAMPLAQAVIDAHGWRTAWRVLAAAAALALPLALVLPWARIADGPYAPRSGTPAGGARTGGDGPTLRDAMRTPAYWRLVQAFSFTAVGSFLVTPQIVAFLVESGFAPMTAASAYGAATMLSTVGIVAAGWLVGRIGYGRTALLTFACSAVGVLALLVASFTQSVVALALHVAFFGLVLGARGPIVSTLANRVFTGRSVATIYGTVHASMSVGAAVGAYAGGLVHDLTGGYAAVFVLSLAAICVAAEPFRAGSSLMRAAAAAP